MTRVMAPAMVRMMLAAAVLLCTEPAVAQIDGNASVMVDVLPDVDEAPGNQTITELRTRVFLERRGSLGSHFRFHLSGYLDALLADRAATSGGTTRDATVRPGDLYLEFVSERFELRGGFSRVVWGRLDEFQPTDVVNPIDLSRFLLEGRAEARLPVALVRGRVFLPGSATVEAILVPSFRAGRFDQLAEASSPFNLVEAQGFDVQREEPDFAAGNVQGGLRFTSTTGRFDWAVSGYRGFRPFPTLTVLPTFAPPPLIVQTFPRFTMVGGDFETVRGSWGVRGEVAAFIDDELQSARFGRGVQGRTIDAGVGVDRKAGDYRVAGNVLWSTRRVSDEPFPNAAAFDLVATELNRSDLSLVVAGERTFARETRNVRLFAVYDPVDATTFLRAIAAISIRDDVWLEGSGGLFAGTAEDTLGRLSRRDFADARLRVFF